MIRQLHIIIILSVIFLIACISCEDEKYATNPNTELTFSIDTIKFDTIFTTIGSTTKPFTVKNNNDQPVLISNIRLANGNDSNFRLNIDGEISREVNEIEIPARDSIYIFVEITIDPNGSNQPMIVQDSIVFSLNEKIQDVDLIAWGQDFVPIDKAIIETTTWTNEKPYLVYDYAYIDSNQILTIDPGCKIYFHNNAGLYVKGTIKANGTTDEPIIFTGDRLEPMYDDVPDQWRGILLYSGSENNIFNNTIIKNANIGLQVGTIEHEGAAQVTINNTRIEHMAYAGIFALKSSITAANSVIANCGYYCVTMLVGGSYEFNHCTVANYWGAYSNRETASVVISNLLNLQNQDGTNSIYVGDLVKASWNNSIIWGNNINEIEFGNNEEVAFNYNFNHSLIKIADSIDTSDDDYFTKIIKNQDPKFIDPFEYNYELDTLSIAQDTASLSIAEKYPFDANGNPRLNDAGPDLGAFERIEKDEKEEDRE